MFMYVLVKLNLYLYSIPEGLNITKTAWKLIIASVKRPAEKSSSGQKILSFFNCLTVLPSC